MMNSMKKPLKQLREQLNESVADMRRSCDQLPTKQETGPRRIRLASALKRIEGARNGTKAFRLPG